MEKIILDGTKNIRDLAGTPSRDGRRIKPRLFIRSAVLDQLSADDAEKLKKQYRLGTVIDLRTETELAEKQDVQIPGVEYLHMPIFKSRIMGISREKAAEESVRRSVPQLSMMYRYMIRDENAVRQLRDILHLIMDHSEDCSVLWHCTAGKDRCGLTAALLLYLLDVDEETIVSDYMETNLVANAVADKIAADVLAESGDAATAEKVRRIYIADPSYLEAALDEVNALYGSLENFIEKGLEISAEERRRFKDKCLI